MFTLHKLPLDHLTLVLNYARIRNSNAAAYLENLDMEGCAHALCEGIASLEHAVVKLVVEREPHVGPRYEDDESDESRSDRSIEESLDENFGHFMMDDEDDGW